MAFITVEGENKIALQQGNAQLLVVDSFVLANIDGLGAEPADRIETMPAGGDIVADLAVTRSGYVNTNQVVYSLVMDSTLGPFDFNWVGLVDADGVVIAVVYVPLTSKTATVGEVPGNNLTRNFLLAFSDIQATTAIAVPAETWQIDFTARLLGIDERERLGNFDIYGLAAFFADGWQVVRQGATTTYDVKAGIGYVGGIRADNAADQQFTDGGPAGVWLDVSLEGDISDVSAVVAIVVDGAAHPDYTDSNGFDHYLTQIADVAANGDVTDLRVNAVHEDKPHPHPQYLTQAQGDAAYDEKGGLVAHAGAADPHPQYLTEAEANAAYITPGMTVTVVEANTAYVPPEGVRALRFIATAGAAGGGGVTGSVGEAAVGVGGPGGSTAIKTTNIIEPSYDIVIGAGGEGGSNGNNAGNAGGNTTVSSANVNLIALGGPGGTGMVSTANTSVNPGVAPPSASGGDINLRGGGTRLRVVNNGELSSDSPGGASFWGGPERSVVNAAALGGQNYGVGGNGANVHNFAGVFPGGAGHDGVVVVEEFY